MTDLAAHRSYIVDIANTLECSIYDKRYSRRLWRKEKNKQRSDRALPGVYTIAAYRRADASNYYDLPDKHTSATHAALLLRYRQFHAHTGTLL